MTAPAWNVALGTALWVLAPQPEPARQLVALAPVGIEGEGSRALAKRISAAIKRGNYEVVLLEGDCEDNDCWRTAADEAGAFVVVVPHVRATEGDHQIGIETYRVADGEVVTAVEDTCDLCGKSELLEMGDDLAGRMRRSLDRIAGKPGVLAVSSAPSGAVVFVDGEEVGVTPLDHTVESGGARDPPRAPRARSPRAND